MSKKYSCHQKVSRQKRSKDRNDLKNGNGTRNRTSSNRMSPSPKCIYHIVQLTNYNLFSVLDNFIFSSSAQND